MERLVNVCTNHSRAVIFCMVIVLIAGISSYMTIPRESSPDVKIPIIYVLVMHEGIAPEDSVNLLVKPIEKGLKTVKNIKKINATAIEGGASIMIEFNAGVDNSAALQNVRSSIDDIMYKLPQGTEKPTIMEIDLSIEPVISVVLDGDMPLRTTLQIARSLKDKLEKLPPILEVNISGDRSEVLEITVNPEMMESYQISIDDVAKAINNNNRLVAAGILHGKTGDYALKVPSIVNEYEQFMSFPIKTNGDAVVLLKDIAQLRNTYKSPNTSTRVNGNSALVLNVRKRVGANIVQTINDVKSLIGSELPSLPSGLNIFYTQDQSKDIRDMVLELENTIIIGIILVMIVMIVTIGTRSAMLVALSIPVSFFAGILMLDLGGHTLNVVVLFSLILTVGMIVDDAIVVSEYANRKMVEGLNSTTAFKIAAVRMFWPIVTSTLVKMVVFMPLLFWPGVMGQFMKYMPITVIAILSSSLVFALFIQPSLGPFFGKLHNVSPEELMSIKAAEDGDLTTLHGSVKHYAAILNALLSRPKTFLAVLSAILVGVYGLYSVANSGKEFFPNVEPERATLVVQAIGNLSLEQKESLLQQCEDKIKYLNNDVLVFYTSSGSFNGSGLPKGTIGTISMEFKDWEQRRPAAVVLKEVREAIAQVTGIKFQILQERMGPPSPKPIALNISSSDATALALFSKKLMLYLKSLEGLIDIDSTDESGSIEWRVLVNRSLAARYGLDIATIGRNVQLITEGVKIAVYNPLNENDQVDIILRFPEQYRTIVQIQNLKVINGLGQAIPLDNFAKLIPSAKIDNIQRINGETTVSISANVADGVLADNKVQEIKNWLAVNNIPAVVVNFSGDEESQDETTAFLGKAFITALVLMFFIMLLQFNNFYHTVVIMSAVFLSTIGVLLGLLIFKQPFSIVMSGVGIIALGGIVLNNNIIFVDTYQYLREVGIEKRQAVILAGVQRFRPIILTALTAVLGLLPMVLRITIDLYARKITYGDPSGQIWRPLATSIVGGLTFATMLTLFFTPCLLLLERDKKNEPEDYHS